MSGLANLSTNKTEIIGCGLVICSITIALLYITYRLTLSECYWGVFMMWCVAVFAIGFGMHVVGENEKIIKYGFRMILGSIIVPDIAMLVCLFNAKNYEAFVTVLVVSLFLSGLYVLGKADEKKKKRL